MIEISSYIDIASKAAVVVTLFVLAYQTREVAKQSRLANKVAGITSNNEQLHALDGILKVFLDRPELRPYFYENRPIHENDLLKQHVQVMAEIIADILACGIQNAGAFEWNNINLPCWVNYAKFLVNNSPALRAVLTDHPEWFPELIKLYK